jgi:hypothetical protein
MSLDDGLVLQIHPGAWRNHNAPLFDRFGPMSARIFRRPPTTSAHCVRCSTLRQRPCAFDHRLHARREHLRA